jgi:hypothetical protein
MNRPRTIFLSVIAFAVISSVIFTFIQFQQLAGFVSSDAIQKKSPESSTIQPLVGSAFVNIASNNVLLPSADDNISPQDTTVTATGGIKESALQNASNTIKTFPASPAQRVTMLSLPDISNSEMVIGENGVSSTIAYATYFNNNYKNIGFNGARFNTVLKDENGIPLFIPALAEKALADNNFGEIKDSLIVQKDFTSAEIAFMKSIEVTGNMVDFDKQIIGSEELTVDLADQALGVVYGDVSRKEFSDFYAAFLTTIAQANSHYVNEVQAVSLVPHKEAPTSPILSFFLTYLSPVAYAQVPFGGPVLTIIPNPVLQGAYVTIGPPVATVVFVPWAFLASPLFFPTKTLAIGSWWLGLYSPGSQLIIMAGTSLPTP